MVFQQQRRKGETVVGRCCFVYGEMGESGKRLLNNDGGKRCGVADSGVLASEESQK